MRTSFRRFKAAALMAALCAVLPVGCSSDDGITTPVATTATISTGNNQIVVTGVAAATPLTVKVVDQNGAALSGATVTFAIASGGGTLSTINATTDASGVASTAYTAGTTAGTAIISATVNGVSPLTFSITVSARTAATLTVQSGSGQSALAGAAVTNPFVVKVVDQTGAALSGVSVSFAATSGGGTLSAATATTDASGLATVNYTAGATAGTSVVTATVAGLTAVTFSTTITAAGNNVLSVVSGNTQTGATGTALANPFVVRVANAAGTVQAGVPVTFAITSGGGSLSTTTATTSATGQASTTYTTGATAGISTITATIAGGSSVTFTSTATAAGANVITIVSGNSQSAATSTALTNPLIVKVADASGNAVTGAAVTFAIASGGGTLSTTSTTTAATGQASTIYTTGTAAGAASITASIAGGGSVTFAATATSTVAVCASEITQTGRVVCLSNAFLATLTTTQQTAVQPAFTKANAIKWSNLPCGASCRNGLQFSTLSATQLTAALAVTQAGLSVAGYNTFDAIRKADTYLGTIGGGNGYNEGIYFIAFLGTPSTTGTWELAFGGHHHAANVVFKGGTSAASITPNFVGVEPQTFTLNGTTYAPLDTRKVAMYAMINGLDATQLAAAKLTATFDDVLLGPNQDGKFPTQQGVLVSSLNATQQALVTTAIRAWVNDAPDELATALIAEYTSATAYASTRIAWSGATTPTVQGSYVRIDGPNVWIEFVCQNGVVVQGQIHFHTIYRDKTRDYGGSFTF